MLSEKNPLLKEIRRAAAHGTLTEDGYAIAEGFHLLDEALASGVGISAVIAQESAWEQIAGRQAKLESVRIEQVSDKAFRELTTTEHPQGLITLARPKTWTMQDVLGERALALVLDGIQDPGNAGAIVRTAEAFGATGVIFLKGSVNPYNPKCLRGSAGSIFRVPLVAGIGEDALLGTFHHDETLYAAMPRATLEACEADFAKPCAIVIGAEGHGVRASLAASATAVRIPTGRVESLNAAVAAGVLLYEASRQRRGRAQ
jgi:RNA methyltransferase, TrmH family